MVTQDKSITRKNPPTLPLTTIHKISVLTGTVVGRAPGLCWALATFLFKLPQAQWEEACEVCRRAQAHCQILVWRQGQQGCVTLILYLRILNLLGISRVARQPRSVLEE